MSEATSATRPSSRLLGVFAWIPTVIVALMIGMAGVAKFAAQGPWIERFEGWGLPGWLLLPVAAAELTGAVLFVIPRLAPIGGTLLASVMFGATLTHMFNGELERVPFTLSLMAAAAALAAYRWRMRRKE